MDDVERFRMAQQLLGAGDPHTAYQVISPLVEQTSASSVLLVAARASYATAALDRAEALFRRVVEGDPSDHYAHAALGRTLSRRSRHEEALVHLRLAAALDPEPWYRDALAAAQGALAARRGLDTPGDALIEP